MFRLLKWLVFIMLMAIIWYGATFYLSLNKQERQQVKKEAIEAIDSGDAKVLTGPLSDRVKGDLLQKKTSFYEMVKDKLKAGIDKLIDSD